MGQNILISETENLPKVKDFLESIRNNSEASASLYRIALSYLNTFLHSNANYQGQTVESILKPLKSEEMDRYTLLQQFINYLTNGGKKLSPRTIRGYVSGIRSYLAFNRIFVNPQEYKQTVKEPKINRRHEDPISESEVRKILLACTNLRLKAYILIFATGGSRARETLAIRLKDIDFNSAPTKISLRAEYTKTRSERYFFISDEATDALKEWIKFKYRPREKEKHNLTKKATDLVFAVYDNRNPKFKGLYLSLVEEFNLVLKKVGLDERKEGMLRRKVTFHSFRRFVYSQVSDVDNQFAEWLLGHEHSTYWTRKPEVMKQKYLECMKYLRFLDYEGIALDNKTVDAKIEHDYKLIEQQRKEIESLKNQIKDMQSSNDEAEKEREKYFKLIDQKLRQMDRKIESIPDKK